MHCYKEPRLAGESTMARQSNRRPSLDASNTPDDLGAKELSLRNRKRDSSSIEDFKGTDTKRPRTGTSRDSTQRTSRSTGSISSNNFDPSSLNPDNPDDLAKFLGFSAFRTTKGIKIPGNNVGVADVKKKQREYTQMLHRRKLYEVPLTRQQLAEKEAADQSKMQE